MPRHRSHLEDVCEDQRRIELSYLRKHGLLTAGRMSTLTWRRDGEVCGRIGVLADAGGITLQYVIGPPSGDRISVREFVPFAMSKTNFGGKRLWLTCPSCRRRVGILYGGGYFRCRACHGLRYESQYAPPYDRALEMADKLRKRVGGDSGAFDDEPFPPKPKWMRRRTYERLAARYDLLTDRFEAELIGRFGLALDGLR